MFTLEIRILKPCRISRCGQSINDREAGIPFPPRALLVALATLHTYKCHFPNKLLPVK
jgi:hypothetical protein